jgi:hypothetical protein
MADVLDPKGKHLLGEAVRLLVQAGVTGSAIADFIAEYSGVVATTLAAAPPEPATDLKTAVKEAIVEVLAELPPPSGRRLKAGARTRTTVQIGGVKTSVALRRDLLEKIQTSVGDSRKVKQLIQDFANSTPAENKNRSAWVEEKLEQHLILLKVEASVDQRLQH